MKQTTPRRSQRERRAESEQKLLAATAQLIVERGMSELSLTAIGQRAGCSHALVNHLFGTKAAMIERLNDTVDEMYRAHIPAAIEGKVGVDAIVALAEAYLTLVTSDDPMARVHVVLWAQAVAGAADIRDSRIEWDRHFRQGMSEVIARATGRSSVDSYCRSSALVIVGLLRGVAMQHLLDPDIGSPATAFDRVRDAIRGIVG
ncbi:TetR/AcrR family transcriptional regulator [Nocardia bovistercoris]|uniref:TetR/AcrR family transcriptional regulator n=1 Tax=Nocardia bovistercoris TaxID=2785916 RepID=A0A931N286_9NOCA|nr:TetR/AcrR family transcriptional regulator [Nocardia bovistercoris]MBH0776659.1 TetR/AcrR family transcriptional regulator [Nocardia bovistercoris]